MLCKYGKRKLQLTDNQLTAILRSCLGRIRTLTGGTRIRRATITPQGNFSLGTEWLACRSLSCFCECKVMLFFLFVQIFLTLFFVVFSDVESEVHYITVLHDVVFAFDRQAAGVADGRFAAKADVVVVFDDFGADESFLEVGVDDASAFGCF